MAPSLENGTNGTTVPMALVPSNGVKGANGVSSYTKLQGSETIDIVLRSFRCLIADLCQQYNGGHPGYVH